MVVFVCSACGASLKKIQVERHSFKCRGCQYVTCLDCSKDFWGNDYANHNTCLTENEKYGGANYVAKEMKGQKKQESWIMQIQQNVAAVHNMNPELKSLFDRILRFDNIPRKKAKFFNFLKSNHCRNNYLMEEAWKFFEDVNKKSSQTSSDDGKPEVSESSSTEVSQTENKDPQRKSKKERKEERQRKQTKVQKVERRKRDVEGDEDEEKPKKKKKRRKVEEEETNQENEEPEEEEMEEEVDVNRKSGSFKWKKAISSILQDAPEEGMKMKKFKRKMLALYIESKGESSNRKSELEIDALIQKKLNMRSDKYVVLKDRVKLRSSN